MNEFPYLETDRLILREIVPEDVPALMAMYSNQEAMKWRGDDHLTTELEVENMVHAFASARPLNGNTHWAMELKSRPGLIGKCGLHGVHHSIRKCMIAYEMNADFRGQGYMAEALTGMLEWTFTKTLINRVGALISPENKDSLRLATRLGFRKEGLERQGARWADTYHDMLSFGLLGPEFIEILPDIQSWMSDPAPLRKRELEVQY